MSESHHDYYGRKLREARENKPMSEVESNEMNRSFDTDQIDMYRKNIADLQEQLQNSYIKQKQLNDELYRLRKLMEQLDGSAKQQKWNF
tara:strand:+ start:36 stop:302 length:267 start_codon:yes stop_codon:yes gene_type:complete